MPTPARTVAVAFVHSAVQRLRGPARDAVLRRCGIAPELLRQPQARVPAAAFAALWMAVARELDDEFFGLDSRRMKVGSFALLCHALIGAPTVDAAMQQALRGFGLFLDDVRAELQADAGRARIVLHNRIDAAHARSDARRFADETLLVMLFGLLCWLAGRRVPLARLEMAHGRPAHADEYGRMFTPTLAFDADVTTIHFDARVLRARPAPDGVALKAFLRDAPLSVFLKQVAGATWSARARRALRAGPPWPDIAATAARWGVSTATLRRRLLEEGTTWSGLKDEARRDLAIHLLADPRLTLSSVAERLGFDDASTFHRAFRKWTGSAPGAYRGGRPQSLPPGTRGGPGRPQSI